VTDGVSGREALAQADQAMARFDFDAVVAHLAAAVRAFTEAGDVRAAAMASARLGNTMANNFGNLTAGRAWFARARRLVEDEPPCIEQGWVAIAAMGCDVDDPAELLVAADLALDRARRFGDVNLETKALADGGLALVQSGRIDEGMGRLDEAMALACGPADDSSTASKSVCSFFTACYYAVDFRRASSWVTLLRRQGLIGLDRIDHAFLSGHCDSVQATLLLELGRWSDAERLLERTRADWESVVGGNSWHPEIALADLRIRQGRLTDAETLLLGKDQAMQALLPAARMHLVRGDVPMARAAARRGLRAIAGDRLRAVELLTLLVDVELAAGDADAATAACAELGERAHDLGVAALEARAMAARARVVAASGDVAGAIELLESAVDHVDAGELPWLHVTLLLDLAGLRERAGDAASSSLDVKAAASTLAGLDVVVAAEHAALLGRVGGERQPSEAAVLSNERKWSTVSFQATTVRLPSTKGLQYLAELIAHPGIERHVLDLVDRVEGVSADGIDRRALGDAGELLDTRARTAYRRRIEQLRTDADDAIAAGRLESAEAAQDELDQLVAQLAAAFGLGGRERKAASAAEKARLNVTRALRASIAKLVEAVPDAGAHLDRRLRTGLYCAYDPGDETLRWTVR
jgi:hypothetical protein